MLQEVEKTQKYKNDLIAKLEGKSEAMADTLRFLDDKYEFESLFVQLFLIVISVLGPKFPFFHVISNIVRLNCLCSLLSRKTTVIFNGLKLIWKDINKQVLSTILARKQLFVIVFPCKLQIEKNHSVLLLLLWPLIIKYMLMEINKYATMKIQIPLIFNLEL